MIICRGLQTISVSFTETLLALRKNCSDGLYYLSVCCTFFVCMFYYSTCCAFGNELPVSLLEHLKKDFIEITNPIAFIAKGTSQGVYHNGLFSMFL